MQYDIYHMQRMEGELAATIKANLPKIAHLQLADNPGRNEPGTGEINYRFLFSFLDRIGYDGWIGCEYKPKAGTEAGLGWRARTALLKAACMMGFGVFVLARALWGAWTGAVPDAAVMGVISLLALAANLGVAWILYAFRNGDANMRSVWLCSRNDAFGNLAVLAAALAVAGTHTVWPDLVVAAVMASLALSGGWSVMRQARSELAAHSAGHSH